MASVAIDLVSGLASGLAAADPESADPESADLVSADLVSAGSVSADLAFDLASGQVGFGVGPAGCHNLNPLYSLYHHTMDDG